MQVREKRYPFQEKINLEWHSPIPINHNLQCQKCLLKHIENYEYSVCGAKFPYVSKTSANNLYAVYETSNQSGTESVTVCK